MNERLPADAWGYALALLAHMLEVSEDRGHQGARSVIARHPPKDQIPARTTPATTNLTVVGRHSDVVIAVCLKDSTAGCYAEQPWRLTRARGRGVCALTSAPIRRGDLIYRPSVRGRAPVNAGWMLLASAIPLIADF
ncbi:DUF3331 domain-containing protein [Paraburkholderia acidiphila]|uniref:DUF3331 domain-containing protein n=1 Tax=Paraburkholderia acidiphila TaxID=2571747 RepID=A0A7Z2JCD9_9BURK|nr:DUF3331 domain-containing protein [Paraburkholderia acidiphila]